MTYDIKRFCLLYFAYGSNIDEGEMKRPGKCSSPVCAGMGYLPEEYVRFLQSTATTGENL